MSTKLNDLRESFALEKQALVKAHMEKVSVMEIKVTTITEDHGKKQRDLEKRMAAMVAEHQATLTLRLREYELLQGELTAKEQQRVMEVESLNSTVKNRDLRIEAAKADFDKQKQGLLDRIESESALADKRLKESSAKVTGTAEKALEAERQKLIAEWTTRVEQVEIKLRAADQDARAKLSEQKMHEELAIEQIENKMKEQELELRKLIDKELGAEDVLKKRLAQAVQSANAAKVEADGQFNLMKDDYQAQLAAKSRQLAQAEKDAKERENSKEAEMGLTLSDMTIKYEASKRQIDAMKKASDAQLQGKDGELLLLKQEVSNLKQRVAELETEEDEEEIEIEIEETIEIVTTKQVAVA